MDPLTDIITGLHIREANFTRMDASAPWGVKSNGEHGINFVLLVRGSAILTTPSSSEAIALSSGDVFLLMGDAPYQLFDHEKSTLIDCVEVERLRRGNSIEIGGGGSVTSFISASFDLHAIEAQPLLHVLPELLHLKLDQRRSLAFQSVIEMLALETESPGLGSEALVSRLFELLFVHAIRAYSMQPGGPTQGWLSAFANRNLRQALEAMHRAPEQVWTVESLAHTAGMSRSSFAACFKAVVGQSPLDYLTRWRIYCATRLLQHGNLTLSEISSQVGYESVSAFSRVFVRITAKTPGAFRKSIVEAKQN
ncbi:AraC family transcriptional regulator [Marinomonas lutimaris]|uniref:Helix-turn-helix-domain containing protein AraC type n=1 Tax=Marinomonas sp. (strain MWYL1) TaxID=400668 RepID=A6VY86_MARMS|nr:AraC family transcriptional regulator [Marinomonas lutimaris]